MNRTLYRAIFLPVLLALFHHAAPVLPSEALAGEQEGRMERARAVVEHSALGPEEKLRILAAGDRAAAAGVPEDDAAIIITRGLDRGAGAGRTAEFLETAVRLREQDLPVRLVLDRIEQGLSKGIPPERIALVAEKLSAHLADARPLVQQMEKAGLKNGGTGSRNAIETVARALEQSISRDAIARTGEQVREQKGSFALFNRAVDTMTTFAGNGMPADEAARIIHTAMDRGCSERELEDMERYMASELRKNRPVKDIVSGMDMRMDTGRMRGGTDRGGSMRSPGSGGLGAGPGTGGRR